MTDFELAASTLKIANNDLAVAKFLHSNMQPKPLYAICYHCQQAVEKSIKAVLYFRGVEVPFTHDVFELLKLVGKTQEGNPFDLSDKMARSFANYASKVRYVNHKIDLIETDAVLALNKAESIIRQAQVVLDYDGRDASHLPGESIHTRNDSNYVRDGYYIIQLVAFTGRREGFAIAHNPTSEQEPYKVWTVDVDSTKGDGKWACYHTRGDFGSLADAESGYEKHIEEFLLDKEIVGERLVVAELLSAVKKRISLEQHANQPIQNLAVQKPSWSTPPQKPKRNNEPTR